MIFDRYIKNFMHEFNNLNRCFWNYEDGCVLIGAQAMYEATNDGYYLESIRNFIDRYVSETDIRYYNPVEYNIDKIPSGRVLFLLYQQTELAAYRQAIELLMNQLRTHPRTQCGSFWHKKIYPYQIWLDGLYMGLPFCLLYENTFGKGIGYADILNQFHNARTHLYDEGTGLYYHAFDEKKEMFWADQITGRSANFWSRAIGWYLMALADCYDLMPVEQDQYRRELAEFWQEAVDGMLAFQDSESGLFYQLTTLPKQEGNYLETSASAMTAYSILKGCRLGVLPQSEYRTNGEKILLGLVTRKFTMTHGKLTLSGICAGAGLGPADNPKRDGSIYYYLSEPVVSDEQKGVGAAMMAYSEWLKLNQEGVLVLPGIEVGIYNEGY